jgi:predicted TIM-barrel fold metal-dependent hydrolase
MLIVDAQIHLWQGEGAPPHHRQSRFSVEEAIAEMDAAGVGGAINHPALWDDGSNAYAIEAAKRYPNRLATLGWLRFDEADAREQVRNWRSQPGMIGLRFLCMKPHERSWPTDGTLDWLWPLAEELGLPIGLGGPTLMPIVAQVAERHPRLKLTIDHFGAMDFSTGAGLVPYADVAVKLSGAPDYASDDYPFVTMHDTIRAYYEAFGADRVFWGSDLTRLPCTWRECVTMFTEHMPFIAEQDLPRIMGGALCDWLGWRPGQSGTASSV